MKILKVFLCAIFIIGASSFIGNLNVEALSSSQGAVISGPETNAEYGHVLYFPNSASSKLNRYSLNRARKFYSSDKAAVWTTLIPTEQPGVQSIEANSFKLTLNYNDGKTTIKDFKDKGIEFHFYTTNDGTNFVDKTDILINQGDFYLVPGSFIGYRVEMIKVDPSATIPDSFDMTANCFVDMDLTKMSPDQLSGQTNLHSWLDSMGPNQAPTVNYQKIFVIQPTINGQVNYQKLSTPNEVPGWSSSVAMQDVWVELIEQTVTGDKVVASTKTNANGEFSFSAINGKNFQISDTSNPLSIRVRKRNYTGWIVKDDNVDASEKLEVNIGRLTDIAQLSDNYDTAISKTNWLSPFDEVREEGKNAVGNKFILTESPTEPSTTEPSTTEPSTTEPSTTEPSTTEPSTTEPSTTEPSTTEPSTTKPSTTKPTTNSKTDSTQSNSIYGIKGPSDNGGTGSGSVSNTKTKNLPRTGMHKPNIAFSIIGTIIIVTIGSLCLSRNIRIKKSKRK